MLRNTDKAGSDELKQVGRGFYSCFIFFSLFCRLSYVANEMIDQTRHNFTACTGYYKYDLGFQMDKYSGLTRV